MLCLWAKSLLFCSSGDVGFPVALKTSMYSLSVMAMLEIQFVCDDDTGTDWSDVAFLSGDEVWDTLGVVFWVGLGGLVVDFLVVAPLEEVLEVDLLAGESLAGDLGLFLDGCAPVTSVKSTSGLFEGRDAARALASSKMEFLSKHDRLRCDQEHV